MLFLAKRLGDITIDDIAEMLPFFLVVMIGVGIIFMIIIKSKQKEEEERNASYPICRMNAKIVDKMQLAPNTMMSVSQMWILFELTDGRRLKLTTRASNEWIVGDTGYLTWQGTSMIRFGRGESGPASRGTNNSPAYTGNTSAYGQDRIPAWKQVEMEREKRSQDE